MVETSDIHTLLQTGSWTTSRAKSPQPHSMSADQSTRPYAGVPRSPRPDLGGHNFPPPPSVEDEAESLAREHGSSLLATSDDEEPKFRGEVDQQPIILAVPEFNPERRFVLVSDPAQELGDTKAGDGTSVSARHEDEAEPLYDANTCKKYVLVTPDEEPKDSSTEKARGLERRRSHKDLPHIDTVPQGHRRAHSMQGGGHVEDDFDRRPGPRRAGNEMLSPVVMHSAKGRDRAYWDYRGGGGKAGSKSRPREEGLRSTAGDERRGDSLGGDGDGHRPAYPENPFTHRRSFSTNDSAPRPDGRAPDRRRRRDSSSARAPLRRSPPRMPKGSSSPAQLDHTSDCPPNRQSTRHGRQWPGSASDYKDRHSSSRREAEGYYDDSYTRGPRASGTGKPVIGQANRSHESSSQDRSRSSVREAPRSPLPSPRLVQGASSGSEPSSNARSATFPRDGTSAGAARPSSSVDSDEAMRSRARQGAGPDQPLPPSAPTVVPVLMPVPGVDGLPGRRENMPVPPPGPSHEKVGQEDAPEPCPQPSSPKDSNGLARLDMRITSYRRYLSDVRRGAAVALRDCPRKTPTAGYVGWLTLPHARSFNVCAECYEATFSHTTFRHSFVPAPLYGAETLISCAFGSCPWYRVAWLMTLKHRIQDLHLLQGVAAVLSKSHQCAGSQPSMRAWYSILDPYTKRPIRNFTVCHHCARAIEVILPNLAGAFVPLEAPPEPTVGVCAMHFTPDRKRFADIFDLLETVSDRALSRNSPPDFQNLADKVRELSLMPECTRDDPMWDGKWFVMEPIPQFTVCEECFDEVVWPLVEADEENTVAHGFFQRTQRRPLAACQLYSDRMREVFQKACRRDDLEYLRDRVMERLDIEAAIKKKLTEDLTPDEARALVRTWEEWE